MTAIRAVVVDVGETLVDETAVWGAWADWLGIPRFTFFGALGGAIARGTDHREAFKLVRPGIDLEVERRARHAAHPHFGVTAADLYPDAMPCLRALVETGLRVGVAGNQPREIETVLRSLDLPLALVASSEGWGVAKPDPAFFSRICEELDLPAAEIAYVGDRLDNDIGPAAAAGMAAVFVRRGPWAILQSAVTDPFSIGAVASIDSLLELRDVIDALATTS
jgi:HAD superfamily hydrolase (TIGR01662 family)